MEAWRCARVLAVMAESLFVDQERRLMDQRRVRTSRLPPLSTRENPCLGAGGCRGGFVGGDLFRVSRYVSTGARELVRDIEKNAPLRRREKSFSSHFQSFYFGFEEIVEKFCQGVPHLRCNQTQSDAIRRNQAQSDAFRRNQHARSFVFPCFRVLGGPQGPVFCVFVF